MTVASDGGVACDFIESFLRVTKGDDAGTSIRLRDWQRELLVALYELRADGRRRYRRGLIGMPRKNGKDLDVDTPVLTTTGWSTMGELQVGREVFTPEGLPTAVVAVSPTYVDHDCYRVSLADGASLIAGAGHLWRVRDRMVSRRTRVIDTETMAATLHSGSTRGDRRYAIDVPGAVKLPDVELPLDPYLLGAWLGDGTTSCGAITSADGVVLDAFDARYPRGCVQPRGAALTVAYLGLCRELRTCGVLGNKHVPDLYLTSGTDQRLALLRGLMDTDGTVSNGIGAAPRVSFCNTNRQLAESVLFLARSLGWKPTIREYDARLNGRVISRAWLVGWTAYRDRSPFALARKTARLAREPDRPTRASSNAVVAVERIDTRPTRCIQVADPSGCYLAGLSLTPTHNSALASGLALFGLFDENGAEVYSAAGDKDQARIVFAETRRAVEADKELSTALHVYRDAIEYPATQSVYRVLSAEAYTKEGLNPSLVIFDEVHVQPNDELWNVMSLGSGTRKQPLMLGITTAGVRYDSTGRDSMCYRMWQYGQQVASGEVDDPTFFFRWWGAPDGADYTDPGVWLAANPALGDYLHLEDFETTIRTTPENEFRTKRLNQWVSATSAWLPGGAWEQCEDSDRVIADHAPVVLGFDGSRSGDATALVVVEHADVPHVDVVALWEKPQDAPPGWTVPRAEVLDAIRAACQRWDVLEIACDMYLWQTEMADLELEGLPITAIDQNPTRMVPATQRFYEAVVGQTLTQSGDPRLARHLDNAVLRVGTKGAQLAKEHRMSPRKIDLAIAAVMALERVALVDTSNVLDSVW